MESKFKERLYRFILLSTAGLILALAMLPQDAGSRLVLGAGGLGLALATLGAHRLPALPDTPAPVLLALMLTLLLWLDPQRHAIWLWGWGVVLVLPQPRWLLLIYVLLAAASWRQVAQVTSPEQTLLTGLLLAALLLLGLARGLGVQMLWQSLSSRARLVSNTMLWSSQQLTHDLPLETTRCRREGSHGELLLLRCPSMHQAALASALTAATRSYESCYQIDGQTLAVLLIHHDLSEARQRREAILATLPFPVQARFVTLVPTLALNTQLAALSRQERPVVVLEEMA